MWILLILIVEYHGHSCGHLIKIWGLDRNTSSVAVDKTIYITTYCPDAYWILKYYGKKQRSKHKLVEMGELLRE